MTATYTDRHGRRWRVVRTEDAYEWWEVARD